MPGPRLRATDAVLRERIAEVLHAAGGRYETADADTITDALLPVVARYCEQLEAGRETWKAKAAEIEQDRNRLAAERDQYHSAARHLAFRIRQVACVWATTLPEMIRTADVYTVLMGVASHVPDRPELRDDLWQRIAGAYEARFENDGHPEDAQAAADEAMSVVQPEMNQLRAERHRLAAAVARVRALHQPMQRAGTTNCAHCSGWNGTRCLGVVTPWPCPTHAALDGTGEA